MKETGESGSTKNKTVILLLIILLTLLWFVGEILVSYHWMKVNRYPVQVRNLRYTDTVTDAGFKMVVISDLHDHEFGKDNEKLIRCVKEQDPEMIILDGDMLNEDSKSDEVPVRLVKGLAEIAPVYYALGNHELDYIGTAEGKKMQKNPENSELVKDLTDAGACVLEEGYRDVEIGGCKVRIGGMYEYAFALDGDNSAENLTGDVRDFLEEFQNTDRYKIMLCHRPDSFVFGDASDYWKIDLVISGHDHGGQVVIPFKGGLYGGDQGWFPPYVHGLYRTGRIRLFVTSGLSSEKQMLPRWNNRPEIAVLKVHGSDGESSKKMDRKTDRRDFTERNIRMKKLKVFSVMDSGGNTVYLRTQISISDKSYAGINVKLKDYLIYLPVGASFDPNEYYDGADKDGILAIQSNVNTVEAGSYYVDYIMNAGAVSGKSRLVVIVQ